MSVERFVSSRMQWASFQENRFFALSIANFYFLDYLHLHYSSLLIISDYFDVCSNELTNNLRAQVVPSHFHFIYLYNLFFFFLMSIIRRWEGTVTSPLCLWQTNIHIYVSKILAYLCIHFKFLSFVAINLQLAPVHI